MKKDVDVWYIVRGIVVVTNIPDPGRGGSGGIYTVNFGGIWD